MQGHRSHKFAFTPRVTPGAGDSGRMRLGQRLVGVELHAQRPGQAASFYAWLLGAASGAEPGSWMPVTLLFEHAVCGVHATTWQGPPPSWVPVVAVRDPGGCLGAGPRARGWGGWTWATGPTWSIAPGPGCAWSTPTTSRWTSIPTPWATPPSSSTSPTRRRRWRPTRGAGPRDRGDGRRRHRLPDAARRRRPRARRSLVRAAAGPALPTGWIPYFEVADLVGTVASAEGEGVQVVLPPTVEEFDLFSVLVDAWGLTSGFYTYRYRGQAELFVRRDDGEVLAYATRSAPWCPRRRARGRPPRRGSARCTRPPGAVVPASGVRGRPAGRFATPGASRGQYCAGETWPATARGGAARRATR